MIKLERWKLLSARDQMGHIASELARAISEENKRGDLFKIMLERALLLVDFSLEDQKWRQNSLSLLIFRDGIAKNYIGEAHDLETLYKAL